MSPLSPWRAGAVRSHSRSCPARLLRFCSARFQFVKLGAVLPFTWAPAGDERADVKAEEEEAVRLSQRALLGSAEVQEEREGR